MAFNNVGGSPAASPALPSLAGSGTTASPLAPPSNSGAGGSVEVSVAPYPVAVPVIKLDASRLNSSTSDSIRELLPLRQSSVKPAKDMVLIKLPVLFKNEAPKIGCTLVEARDPNARSPDPLLPTL